MSQAERSPTAAASRWIGHFKQPDSRDPLQKLPRFILDPLEMKDTGIHLSPPVGVPFAQGHDAQAEPVPLWDFPTLPGAGALRSTANDMLLFLAANLSSDEGPIFDALRRTHEVRAPDVAPGLSMALGWLVNERNPDRPIIWHNGGTGGFHSFIGFDPSGGRAVVVLTNGTLLRKHAGRDGVLLPTHLLFYRRARARPELYLDVRIEGIDLDPTLGMRDLARPS